MASKNSLADGLRSLSNKPSSKAVPVPEAIVDKTDKGKHYRPSRDGTKAITAHADPAVSKQLRQLALDEDTNVQALVHEALNLLFEKYQLPMIAPSRDKA
jgi:hypothetical protein